MIGYSAKQISQAERPYLAAGEPLMQRAAAGLAVCVEETIGEEEGPVLVLAGAGNNGADALYAAAILSAASKSVQLLPVMEKVHPDGLAVAVAAGAELLLQPGAPEEEIVAAIRGASPVLVIDAMLGTGSAGRSALRGGAKAAALELLSLKAAGLDFRVVAADLPSGLDPDTGKDPGNLVLPADATATFGAAKAGLLIGDGPRLSGRIRVIEIGIEDELAKMTPTVELKGHSNG